ncbi:MAG: hypothetical protein ACE5R6_10520 [Candidatus Heimdallarchaeota archaeon]
MRWRRTALLIVLIIAPILLTIAAVTTVRTATSQEPRIIELIAYQFGWDPEKITVQVGETIIFRVTANDTAHGFYIDGKDIFLDVFPFQVVDTEPILFDRPGKFKIRCSLPCGPLHPFMVADLIVEPNYPFYIFIGSTMVLTVGSVLTLQKNSSSGSPMLTQDEGIDLLRLPIIGKALGRFLRWRGVYFFLVWPSLFIFMIVLLTGFFGNPMGGFNFAIAVVWILWFAAVEIMILLGGRIWCATCPLPAYGLWLTRRRTYSVREPRNELSLNKTWPKRLRNIWIPTLTFLGISLISPWLVTQPFISALLFLTLIIIAFVVHLVFGGERNFCRYICPAGAYIGYHSTYASLSVRSKDKSICKKCTTKACMRGSPRGYGCPWKLYPGGNESNTNCGLDFECLKSCPMDNMTLKLQKPGKDLTAKVRTNTSEAWMGFVRFSLVIFYEFVLLGPYFWIKDWASMGVKFGANLYTAHLLVPTAEGFVNWLKWAALTASVPLVIVPAIFFAFSWAAHRVAGGQHGATKRTFLAMTYTLAPYALFLWVAFALPLLFVSWAYPLRAFSDPFGWGWNIFGTATIPWRPLFPDLIPFVQAVLVFLGLIVAIRITHGIALRLFKAPKNATRATYIMSIFHMASTMVFIWLLMG